jgi:hypothetical protein
MRLMARDPNLQENRTVENRVASKKALSALIRNLSLSQKPSISRAYRNYISYLDKLFYDKIVGNGPFVQNLRALV